MRRRLLLIAAIACAVAAVIAWRLVRRSGSSTAIDPQRAAEVRALVDKARAAEPTAKTPGHVVIRGVVRDATGGTPVAGMTVHVDAPGVTPTTSGPDGAFAFEVPPGWYRIYALGEEHASVARVSRDRLPTRPRPQPRGVTTDRLPLVEVRDHVVGLELPVARMHEVNVRVTDPGGRPVAAASVRARGAVLPVDHGELGTTNHEGKTWLRLPAGQYRLEAAHDDFAGPRDTQVIEVEPTGMTMFDVVLARGCIVEGRVVDTHGTPAGDGAIERRSGFTDRDFGPAGSITNEGRFTWATLDTGEVILRAWPWGSPPSGSRSFICTDGGRFRDVELRLGNAPPDLHGTLVDAEGAPVPFAFLDVIALDDTGGNQQERTDASGRWGVFHLAPGRYVVSAQTPRGLVSEILVAPSPEMVLKLEAPGTLVGATRGMTDGSFELIGASCRQSNVGNIALHEVTRIVPVRGGRFEVGDLPACTLDAHALYRAHHAPFRIDIPTGGVTGVELDLGPLPDKTIQGTVRDDAGRIVADAVVTATLPKGGSGLARSDERGRFTLAAPAGTSLMATGAGGVGYATVGGANVDVELVDIVLGEGRPPSIE